MLSAAQGCPRDRRAEPSGGAVGGAVGCAVTPSGLCCWRDRRAGRCRMPSAVGLCAVRRCCAAVPSDDRRAEPSGCAVGGAVAQGCPAVLLRCPRVD